MYGRMISSKDKLFKEMQVILNIVSVAALRVLCFAMYANDSRKSLAGKVLMTILRLSKMVLIYLIMNSC